MKHLDTGRSLLRSAVAASCLSFFSCFFLISPAINYALINIFLVSSILADGCLHDK
jgi:hypothetical protein